ncbi:MAG TPA: hypothetical protein VM389_13930 [Phycisphaerae bacterium]|nr:hypothetical protein [Phycisphaerae bacterium]HUU23627.1 hypothetical protein [Phycisphaerae bacterium]
MTVKTTRTAGRAGGPKGRSRGRSGTPNHLQPGPPSGQHVPAKMLREQYGVPRRLFARLMSVSERTLADLEAGKAPSEPIARRLTEMARLHRELGQVIRADTIAEWLQRPSEAFDGLKPIEVVERGQTDRIWRMIFDLESGVPG